MTSVNHFESFIDKIYCFFHTSNKNQMELNSIAQHLEVEIRKIGGVFGPRWVACSARATKAVWKAYAALYAHLSKNNLIGLKKKDGKYVSLKTWL
jgi:hypothetical protein